MKPFYIILISCFTFILSSCDIPSFIDVENCSNSLATYLMYFDTLEGRKDTVFFKIPPNETKGMMFGFGQRWTDERIREYVSKIRKIETITTSDTLIISDKKELFAYFRKRRGLFKQTIKIKIE